MPLGLGQHLGQRQGQAEPGTGRRVLVVPALGEPQLDDVGALLEAHVATVSGDAGETPLFLGGNQERLPRGRARILAGWRRRRGRSCVCVCARARACCCERGVRAEAWGEPQMAPGGVPPRFQAGRCACLTCLHWEVRGRGTAETPWEWVSHPPFVGEGRVSRAARENAHRPPPMAPQAAAAHLQGL